MYPLLLTVHVLLVGIWLGTDFGTMICFRRLCSARLPVPVRLEMGRISDALDMGPRSALIVLLMLGLLLTNLGGWGLAGPAGRAAALVAAGLGAIWLAAVWHQYWVGRAPAEQPRGARHLRFQRVFRTVDLAWRAVVAAALAAAGLAALTGHGPIRAGWLGLKLILFGLIILCGFALRMMLPRLGRAIGEIAASGSTPEREEALAAAARPAYPTVVAIWCLIGLIAYLAVAKPL